MTNEELINEQIQEINDEQLRQVKRSIKSGIEGINAISREITRLIEQRAQMQADLKAVSYTPKTRAELGL